MDIHNLRWIVARRELLRGDLLEIGSFIVPGQESISVRLGIEKYVDSYTGIDMRAGPGVDLITSEDNAFPFQDNAFDIVVCFDTIEHAKDPWSLIASAARVMKPGGYLFLAAPFSFPIHGYPDDYWRFTPRGLQLLIEEAGLEVFGDVTNTKDVAIEPNAEHWLANPSEVRTLARKPLA